MTTDDPSATAFAIRAALMGHDGAVRCACPLPNGRLATGAMDTAVLQWDAEEGSADHVTERVYGHEHWVTALLPVGAGLHPALPDGGFVTGSMDRRIRVFGLDGQLHATLEGHAGGVISLAWRPPHDASPGAAPTLLSGSWDGTARVWELTTGRCLRVLDGHENGVCVLGLPDGTVVTGSTGRQEGNAVVDFQLRYWDKETLALVRSQRDHTGPIRQLALVPGVGFVSCSNDGSLRVRTLDGEVIARMEHPPNAEGKPGFVLGVAVLPDQHLVSASEDCTARVWTIDGTLVQTIAHPAGLWCVTALPNGDFVTGADDKLARIFTADLDKVSPAAVAELAAAVEEAELTRTRGPSGVEIAKLPDYDLRLQVVGKSDGQIQMFRRGAKAWACQWSGPSKTWVDIGEVTGTGSGGVVDGKAYDMVIPVEIDQPGGGLQRLEIGYNQGDNPFMVAQEFINKHMLDQNYLREIADYITQRSGDYRPPVLGSDDSSADASAPTYAHTDSAQEHHKQFKFFPVTTYHTFETTKIAKLMSTVRQYNEKLTGDQVLSESELSSLDRIAHTVQDTAFYHSSHFAGRDVTTLASAIAHWPSAHVFPLLDLLRIVLIHPQGPSALGRAALESIVTHCLSHGANLDINVPIATRMLPLRVLANMFVHVEARSVVVTKRDEILKHLSVFTQYRQKTVALGLATLLLNFARLETASPGSLGSDALVTVGSIAFDLLNGATSVGEVGEDAVLRCLVTVGSLALQGDQETKNILATLYNVFLASPTAQGDSSAIRDCVEELTQCFALV